MSVGYGGIDTLVKDVWEHACADECWEIILTEMVERESSLRLPESLSLSFSLSLLPVPG